MNYQDIDQGDLQAAMDAVPAAESRSIEAEAEAPAPASPGASAVSTIPVPTPSPAAVGPEPAARPDPLRVIAQIESAGGANKAHAKITNPHSMHFGDTAGGAHGMMPRTVIDTVETNPILRKLYGPILAGKTHDEISTLMNQDPKMDEAIATAHWGHLLAATRGNEEKAAIAWYGGLGNENNGLGLWERAKAGEPLSAEQKARVADLDQYRASYDAFATKPLGPLSTAPGPVVGSAVRPEAILPPGIETPAGFEFRPMTSGPSGAPSVSSPPAAAAAETLPPGTHRDEKGVLIDDKSMLPSTAQATPPPGGGFGGAVPSGTMETERAIAAADQAGQPRKAVSPDAFYQPEAQAAAKADPLSETASQIHDLQKQIVDMIQKNEKWSDDQQKWMADYLNKMPTQVDPNHLWASMSTGHKILAAIGMMMGSVGGAIAHRPDEATQMIRDAISRDVDAQKAMLGQKATLYADMIHHFGNERQARTASVLALNQVVRSMVNELRAEKGKPMSGASADKVAALNTGIATLDSWHDQLKQTFPGLVGKVVASIPIATKTRIAREAKPAIDIAITNALKTGRFSPQIIEEVAKTIPGVENTPGMREALYSIVRQMLVTQRDNLAAGGGGNAPPSEAGAGGGAASGYQDVENEAGDEGDEGG